MFCNLCGNVALKTVAGFLTLCVLKSARAPGPTSINSVSSVNKYRAALVGTLFDAIPPSPMVPGKMQKTYTTLAIDKNLCGGTWHASRTEVSAQPRKPFSPVDGVRAVPLYLTIQLCACELPVTVCIPDVRNFACGGVRCTLKHVGIRFVSTAFSCSFVHLI